MLLSRENEMKMVSMKSGMLRTAAALCAQRSGLNEEDSTAHPSESRLETTMKTRIEARELTKQFSMEQDTLPATLMSRKGRTVPE